MTLLAVEFLTDFFAWPGWSAFVALGTLGLAFFTWRAVRRSGQQIKLQTKEVKAVETQVALSSAALEASARPVIVAWEVPKGWRAVAQEPLAGLPSMERLVYWNDLSVDINPAQVHYHESDDNMLYCSIPLRNVGAGIAFIQSVVLVTRTEYPGRVSRVVVPRDETSRASFAVALRELGSNRATDAVEVTRQGRGFEKFVVRIVCTGSSQDLVTTTEIETAGLPNGGHIFTRQRVWDGLERTDERLIVSTDNIGG